MRLVNLALFSTGLCFALFACRGSDSKGDDVTTPDAPIGGSVKIMDIQNDTMPVGTAVEVRGVVVTAIDAFGDRTGDLWVQDPAGGPFSGVKVFGAPLDQVASVAVGDLVDITNAEKDEFALTSDISGRKVTEIKGAGGGMMTITKKGTGTVPAPADVDAKAIALMAKADREAEWEKWEGVLIKVTGARQLAAERTFGSTPGADSHEFRITGIARVQSVLADLNTDSGFGVCYASITGIGDYFFNDLVLPRSAADIVSGGTGCNAFATTVVEAQTGTSVELAQLTNVVVTARDDIGNNKGYWVSDSAIAAVSAGVYVFTGDNAVPTTFTLGAVVNVQGFMSEFDPTPPGDTLTELTIDGTAVGMLVSAGPAPTPLVATPAQLAPLVAGEPYEGVLVQLAQPMKVTASLNQGKFELTANDNTTIVMDDDAFAPATAPTVGTCYTSVVGVMSVQLTDDIRTINPRQAADLVVGAGCN